MSNVTLKLTLGNFSVEVSGPADYAEAKLEELVSRYFTPSKVALGESRPVPIPLEQGGKKLAPGEFLRKVNHKNQPDRALALAYYLEKVEGLPSFTTTELADIGKSVKHPFSNSSDVVAKLSSRGLMMSAGDKDGQRGYALTASGEEYVESMLEAKSA